jgi:hypothetical protein
MGTLTPQHAPERGLSSQPATKKHRHPSMRVGTVHNHCRPFVPSKEKGNDGVDGGAGGVAALDLLDADGAVLHDLRRQHRRCHVLDPPVHPLLLLELLLDVPPGQEHDRCVGTSQSLTEDPKQPIFFVEEADVLRKFVCRALSSDLLSFMHKSTFVPLGRPGTRRTSASKLAGSSPCNFAKGRGRAVVLLARRRSIEIGFDGEENAAVRYVVPCLSFVRGARQPIQVASVPSRWFGPRPRR